MSRNLQLVAGEKYHIYNRGTEKRKVFNSKADYERFIALLYLCNSRDPVRLDNLIQQGSTLLDILQGKRDGPLAHVLAYCLMPNHFHLLIEEKEDGGISKLMQKIMTAYTMYFNTRYERTGALFQGKFKATHVDEDRYLSYLLAYIHLNPVKLIEPKWKETGIAQRRRAERFLEAYSYSSYPDYIKRPRAQTVIIRPDLFPTSLQTPRDFKKTIQEWLIYKDKDAV